jgi:hypothetical protein
VSVTLTIDRRCQNDKGVEIPIGTVVEYCCHVVGGMVRIRWNGEESIIHPLATKELRS